jgi:catechol 2,3-dioxygenase-like lactoylglutathione lyase family enzyme
MTLCGIDHVQLAMPAGGETAARAFYGEVLGLDEVTKPAELAGRGGVWFRNDVMKVHLGVESDFRPAVKAHPAFLTGDFAGLVAALDRAGHDVAADRDHLGRRRLYVADPFGNRLKIVEVP